LVDIFQEVDEEVRRERLKQLWDRYGTYAVALALVIVVAVGAWRAYDWWQAKKAAESGAAFEAAMALAEQNKHADAEAAFAKISTDGTAGYRAIAGLREAEQTALGDPSAAIKAYDALAADSSIGRVLQSYAAVRAGLILVDSAPYSEMQARLEPLTGNDNAFRHTARELLALSAWRAGDRTSERHWLDLILNDPETPTGLRSRVDVLMALSADDHKG